MNQSHPTTAEIIDYLHAELGPSADAAVHAHLAGCPQCAELREAESQLSDLLFATARARERDLPPGFAQRIRAAALAAPSQGWWPRTIASVRPLVAVPVAAGLAIAIYAGVAWRPAQEHVATIDASYFLEDHASLATTAAFSDTLAPVDFADVSEPGGNDASR